MSAVAREPLSLRTIGLGIRSYMQNRHLTTSDLFLQFASQAILAEGAFQVGASSYLQKIVPIIYLEQIL